MEIQRAQPEDAEKLSQIACAAKAHWKYPRKWLDLWKDALTITPENITENEVYAMAENNEIVGFYELKINETTAALENLWIKPENIGAGIGRKLFNHAVEKAAALNVRTLHIVSDPHAEGFYQKMGARRIGDVVSEIGGNERILPMLQIVL